MGHQSEDRMVITLDPSTEKELALLKLMESKFNQEMFLLKLELNRILDNYDARFKEMEARWNKHSQQS